MILNYICEATKRLESKNYPLLGPNLKGLYTFGLLHNENRYIKYFFKFIHISCSIFVVSQLIDLYLMRNDNKKVLINVSVTALTIVSMSKTLSCLLYQSHLKKIINIISSEEIDVLKKGEGFILKLMKKYILYVRLVTHLYWFVVFITNVVTIVSPFVKYATTASYKESIKKGTEPFPQILSSWFPFNNTKMPGYLWACIIHVVMTTQTAGAVAVYDANAVAIMTFFKGHFIILREKCRRIFGGDETVLSEAEVLERIKECHRHHTFLLTQYQRFNAFIAPVMFIYVLLCSISICCSVVQLNLENVSNTEKFWVLEYTSALTIQLFLYCWHSNEIAVESNRVDQGVFESNWWKADLRQRKHLILLSGKLARPLIMNAGPFTELSVPTFVDILKKSYSFYTLVTRMQEKYIQLSTTSNKSSTIPK